MKSFLAVLLSTLLCVQPVYTIQAREPVLYSETQESENTQEGEETQENGDTQEDEETQEGENTQESENTQEDADTNGSVDAQEEADTQEEADAQEGTGTTGQVEVSAPSAILMESSTGQVIFEKDADTQRPPASVTKVMTLLLIFDALDGGKINLEDQVTTSEYAASMGGSQVFLEPGEVQTVDTMIKCISVASANDACVAFKNSRQKIYGNTAVQLL